MTTIEILKGMSADDLWELHQKLSATLQRKITEKKAKLEERLHRLAAPNVVTLDRVRLPHPPVAAKYQNPKDSSETWSGRGRQPLWLKKELREGKNLEHFLITRATINKRRRMG